MWRNSSLVLNSRVWIPKIMWNMFFLVLMLLHSCPRETTCCSKVQFLEIKSSESACGDTVASHHHNNSNNQTPCCLCHVVFKNQWACYCGIGVFLVCVWTSHTARLCVCMWAHTHTNTLTPCVCLHLYYPRWNALSKTNRFVPRTTECLSAEKHPPHKNVTDVKHAQSAGSTQPVRWVVSTQDPVNEEFILSIMSVCCPW